MNTVRAVLKISIPYTPVGTEEERIAVNGSRTPRAVIRKVWPRTALDRVLSATVSNARRAGKGFQNLTGLVLLCFEQSGSASAPAMRRCHPAGPSAIAGLCR
jgi:hypothetical protein